MKEEADRVMYVEIIAATEGINRMANGSQIASKHGSISYSREPQEET